MYNGLSIQNFPYAPPVKSLLHYPKAHMMYAGFTPYGLPVITIAIVAIMRSKHVLKKRIKKIDRRIAHIKGKKRRAKLNLRKRQLALRISRLTRRKKRLKALLKRKNARFASLKKQKGRGGSAEIASAQSYIDNLPEEEFDIEDEGLEGDEMSNFDEEFGEGSAMQMDVMDEGGGLEEYKIPLIVGGMLLASGLGYMALSQGKKKKK